MQQARGRVCQTSSPVPQLLKATQTKIQPKQLGDKQEQQESMVFNQLYGPIQIHDPNFKKLLPAQKHASRSRGEMSSQLTNKASFNQTRLIDDDFSRHLLVQSQ